MRQSRFRNFFWTVAGFFFLVLPLVAFGAIGTGPSSGIESFEVKNPLAVKSFCGLIKALLETAIVIGVPIAVLFLVYAGFKFVTAQGKPTSLEVARRNLLYTIIGIGIFLGAWLIANVITATVQQLGVQGIESCR